MYVCEKDESSLSHLKEIVSWLEICNIIYRSTIEYLSRDKLQIIVTYSWMSELKLKTIVSKDITLYTNLKWKFKKKYTDNEIKYSTINYGDPCL